MLGQRPFDEQIVAALALDEGHVVEMQTGEGKTLRRGDAGGAATRSTGRGVHVLTFNDYLARRDAEWMGPVYRLLGLSVGYVQQGMPRRRATRAPTPPTSPTSPPRKPGFDHLRDLLAMDAGRPGASAVPLRARGRGRLAPDRRGARAARDRRAASSADVARRRGWRELVASLSPGVHFDTDEYGRDIELTEAGIEHVERALGCGGLHRAENLDAADRAELRAARPASCSAATSTTSSATAASRSWTSSPAASSRIATGPTACRPRSKPRRASSAPRRRADPRRR